MLSFHTSQPLPKLVVLRLQLIHLRLQVNDRPYPREINTIFVRKLLYFAKHLNVIRRVSTPTSPRPLGRHEPHAVVGAERLSVESG